MPIAPAKPLEKLPAPVKRYAAHTQRPLVSLAFATPLLVVYELGVLAFPDAARNGADVWMRGWLEAVGLSGYCLLPLLTVGFLLAWHHTTHQPWRLPRGVLLGMVGESIIMGILLLALANVATGWMSSAVSVHAAAIGDQLPAGMSAGDGMRLWFAWPALERLLARGVEYVGAGLYEEVLFRLLLLPLILAMLATCIPKRHVRSAIAIATTSLLFAAAHHVGMHGEAFNATVFLFRTAAGVFFAMLFLRRGFGIAIGAHAAYDLIAGLCFS